MIFEPTSYELFIICGGYKIVSITIMLLLLILLGYVVCHAIQFTHESERLYRRSVKELSPLSRTDPG